MTAVFDEAVDAAKAANNIVSDVVAEVEIGLVDYLVVPAVQVLLGIFCEAHRRNQAEGKGPA